MTHPYINSLSRNGSSESLDSARQAHGSPATSDADRDAYVTDRAAPRRAGRGSGSDAESDFPRITSKPSLAPGGDWWPPLRQVGRHFLARAEGIVDNMRAAVARKKAELALSRQLRFEINGIDDEADVAAFYSCSSSDVKVRTAALYAANPCALDGVRAPFEAAVKIESTDARVIRGLRTLLDRILGPCATHHEARRRVVKLYMTQHPDKVGKFDYGCTVANAWADNMYELLNLSKAALSNKRMAPALYPTHSPALRRYIEGAFLFFFILSAWRGDGSLAPLSPCDEPVNSTGDFNCQIG